MKPAESQSDNRPKEKQTVPYLADTFYWYNPDFPMTTALRVTAATVGRWCRYYEAQIMAPDRCKSDESRREGVLPDDLHDRSAFIERLLRWVESCSVAFTFRLVMDDSPIKDGVQGDPKFARYEDDTMVLHLREEEFRELQESWRSAGLPDDLFAPEEDFFCIPWPGSSLWARLWRALGVLKCYSPKDAEHDGLAKGRT